MRLSLRYMLIPVSVYRDRTFLSSELRPPKPARAPHYSSGECTTLSIAMNRSDTLAALIVLDRNGV